MRADGAVRAEGLNVFVFQVFPGILWARAAEGGAFVGVGEFSGDGQTRERADGVHGGYEFFDVAESFEHKQIHAAFFERAGLFFENGDDFVVRQFADVLNDSEWADGAGDQDFVLGSFAGFARDFYRAMIQLGNATAHAELRRVCGDWR